MKRGDKKLGEILVGRGVITKTQLDDALAVQRSTREFLGAILVNKRYVSEKDLLTSLASQFNIPIATLKDTYIDWALVKQFSSSLILESGCFPVKRNDGVITFAITNPLDPWAPKKADEEARGLQTDFVLVSPSDMEEARQRYKQFMRGMISGML